MNPTVTIRIEMQGSGDTAVTGVGVVGAAPGPPGVADGADASVAAGVGAAPGPPDFDQGVAVVGEVAPGPPDFDQGVEAGDA